SPTWPCARTRCSTWRGSATPGAACSPTWRTPPSTGPPERGRRGRVVGSERPDHDLAAGRELLPRRGVGLDDALAEDLAEAARYHDVPGLLEHLGGLVERQVDDVGHRALRTAAHH